MGKGRRGNLLSIECLLCSRLWTRCFTHIILFNHHRGLMKPLFILAFLDEEAEAQRIKAIFQAFIAIKWCS